MPKLRSVDVKYVNGLQVDKENDDVIYNDEKHLYLDKVTGKKYTSTTTLVGFYCQPFDEVFWSSYKACESLVEPEAWRYLKRELLQNKIWKDSYLNEYDIDPNMFASKVAEIKDGYKKNREDSCRRGTEIHAKFEDMYSDPEHVEIKKFGLGGSFKTNAGYYKLDCDRGVYPEFLISHKFDDYLMLSGQVDLLIKDGNEITIVDYKTNKKIDLKSYFDNVTKKSQKMKFPLNNIDDSNYWHYVLQLSIYGYLLQKINPKFKIKKLIIYHIDHNGVETEYECPYLKEDVERMLLHYRKENKKKLLLEKDKPIVW